jgi:Flp pilus assembly CpaF family ATPase
VTTTADPRRAAGDQPSPQRVRILRSRVAERLRERRAADEAAGVLPLSPDDERAYARSLINQELDADARDMLSTGTAPLSPDDELALAKAVHDALFGLGRLQALLDDAQIENVDANGCDDVWLEYADGTVTQGPPIAESDDEMVELIRSMAAYAGFAARRFDMGFPILDLRLPGGHRLAAIMGVSTRPALSIRRPRFNRVFMADLVRLNMLDRGLAAFLVAAVRARCNLVIAGETGAGKTTLLRALANEIDPGERLITIENALELGLHEHKDLHNNVIALEARQANVEGEGEITMATLVQRTLRHNPSRVIVGEVLGDEIVSMLEAMSQGNAGSLCTIHSSSPEFTFRRIAMYAAKSSMRLPVEVTYQMVEGALDFVVFIERRMETTPDGRRRRLRRVTSILEVLEADGRQVQSNQVFRPGPDGRVMPYTPPRMLDRLVLDGGYDDTLFAHHAMSDGWGSR